jgi:hypothetical protein
MAPRQKKKTLSLETQQLSQNDRRTASLRERRILMTTTTKSNHRATVTLMLPKSVPALIVYARGVVKRMTGNPAFPNPVPSLSVVTAAIDDLRAAETAVLARTKGSAAVRNEKRTALVAQLQ